MKVIDLPTSSSLIETCTAHARTQGRHCTRPALPGTTVCELHGGATPQVRAAAARRLTEIAGVAMERLLERLEADAHNDPLYQIDPKALTDIIDKTTKLAQLLSGEATERKETRSTDVKLRLNQKLDNLASRLGLADELAQSAAGDNAGPDEFMDVDSAEVIETEEDE